MLRHEERTTAVNPAQARVTAEEFAAALAALEARRAEGRSNTIAIGEAVQELGLDAAPEEVWVEVQSERARKAAARAAEEEAARLRAEVAARQALIPRPRTHFPRAFVILAVVFLAMRFGAHAHSHASAWYPPAASFAAPQGTRALASIPDGVPVYCHLDTVREIVWDPTSWNPGYVSVNESAHISNGWTLIRHDGHVYLRGYILPQPEQPASITELSLYNRRGVGELQGKHGAAVTVPLENAHWKDGRSLTDWGEITLTGVDPDSHFRESW